MQAGFEHVRGLGMADAGRGSPRRRSRCSPRPPASRAARRSSSTATSSRSRLHESVGHAVELDRVLGTEASYAGTSFVTVGDVGSLRYGSELMNVTADATVAGGLGSYGWDDEGVQARTEPIVRHGVLAGFLSSRESAAEIGLERSGGCMRADGFARQPIVRMSNVNLEPGDAGHARRPDRVHRPRPLPRDEPLVVDRLAPAALPVRDRGGLGDRRRRARPAAAQPELQRHHARVLAQPRRDLLAVRVAAVGAHELRQGRAGAGDARLARHRAGPLPRRAGGRSVSWALRAGRARPRGRAGRRCARPRDRRALADDAVRAVAADPVHRDRRRDRARGRGARRPGGQRDHEPHRPRRPRGVRARGGRCRGGGGAHRRAGRVPGLPRGRAGAPARGVRRRHGRARPGGRRRGARGGVRGVRRARRRGARHVVGWRRERGRGLAGGRARERPRDRRVHEGHRGSPRTGAAASRRGRRRRSRGSTRARWPSGRRRRPLSRASRCGCRRASTRWCSRPTPWASCCRGSARSRTTGSPTRRAAARCAAGWASASPPRASTSPTRRASPARCRARSTPRACRRRRCR